MSVIARSAQQAFDTPRLARPLALAGGALGAGAAGALAAHAGAGTAATVVAGGAVLLAAFLSSYAALALLVVLLLVPLSEGGELPLHINQIDAVYAAALAGLAVRTAASGVRLRSSALGLALAVFVLAGLLALIAGLLGSADTSAALRHFRGLFGYALMPLLALSLGAGAAEKRRMLLYLLAIAGALTAARGVLSWADLNDVVQLNGVLHRIASPDDVALVGAVPALSGDFGYLRAWAGNFEGNTLGAFVLAVLPVAAYLAARDGNPLLRLVFAAAAALLAFALLVSYSRGAYLGLAAASLPVLLALGRQRPHVAVALAVAGIALLVFLIQQVPGAEDRLVTFRALGQDPTVQHRQLVYQEILDFTIHSPVWGIGLGTAAGAIGTSADSVYLFLLLRGGLLAAAAFVALGWLAVRAVATAWRDGRLTGLDFAVATALLAIAVHSAVDYTLWNAKVALTVWLLAGLLMAAALERPQTQAERPDGEEGTARRRW